MKKFLAAILITSFLCSSQAGIVYGKNAGTRENDRAASSEDIDANGKNNRRTAKNQTELGNMVTNVLLFAAVAVMLGLASRDKGDESEKDNKQKSGLKRRQKKQD